MINVGINGFGRIGRQVFKIISDKYRDKMKVTAVNDIADVNTLLHLLRYDSTYGRTDGVEKVSGNSFVFRGDETAVFGESIPGKIPWKKQDVDIVIESTSLFRSRESCLGHLSGGVKKVIISAPSVDADATIVMGVNENTLNDGHIVISNASCTTNGLAPVLKLLNDEYGIKRGMATTVHSYTGDQRLLDLSHRDLRRSRAAALNIIPTTTGAGTAVGKVIPELYGKIKCLSVRVPVPTVSMLDISVEMMKETTAEEVNKLFKEASAGGEIIGYTDEKLVSSDFMGTEHSTVIDGPSTVVLERNMLKAVAWYDNEWGYSSRLADLTAYVGEIL